MACTPCFARLGTMNREMNPDPNLTSQEIELTIVSARAPVWLVRPDGAARLLSLLYQFLASPA